MGIGPAPAGVASRPRTRAAPGLRPGVLRPPARSSLTAGQTAESAARQPQRRRTARRKAPHLREKVCNKGRCANRRAVPLASGEGEREKTPRDAGPAPAKAGDIAEPRARRGRCSGPSRGRHKEYGRSSSPSLSQRTNDPRHPEVRGASRASKDERPQASTPRPSPFEARHSASKTRVNALMARSSG